jgi:hypothetical protein
MPTLTPQLSPLGIGRTKPRPDGPILAPTTLRASTPGCSPLSVSLSCYFVSTAMKDPRVAALVSEAAAIEQWSTDERYWRIVDSMAEMNFSDSFGVVQALCVSESAAHRRIGADLLAQLGPRAFEQHPSSAEDAVDELLELTSPEEDEDVLCSAIIAAGSLRRDSLRRAVLTNVHHTSTKVRIAVAIALPTLVNAGVKHDGSWIDAEEDPTVVTALITLSRDSEAAVRDFATFALGSQIESTADNVREALAARLNDTDQPTAGEALVGLARRNDPRARAAVLEHLRHLRLTGHVVEAAAELGDPSALPMLIELRDEIGRVGMERSLLDRAISACSGRPQIRETSTDHPTLRARVDRRSA